MEDVGPGGTTEHDGGGISLPHPLHSHSPLAESFGYSEHSSTNTMALLNQANTVAREKPMPPSIFDEIRREFDRIPPRAVLDFLVQYHVQELNWMKHVIHGATFLYRYQTWWARHNRLSVADIEFAVLILRVCAYAAQFLPSPAKSVDTIHGMSLSDIRRTSSEVADSLANLCCSLDSKGSLVRVQHMLYASMKASCEGRTDKFWDGIVAASRAALSAGIHTDITAPGYYGTQALEQELCRRTFCSLFVLDSHLSRQLDRFPILPDHLVAENLPRMRLAGDLNEMNGDSEAPEPFAERMMQVQLGIFWRRYSRERKMPYDPTEAEQRYEKFAAEYLPTLPPVFALEPDTRWDSRLPKLVMQRQLLHIAIFDSVCWNFRPLLLLKPDHVASLPAYKRVLLRSQKRRMCMAVLKELETVSMLHSLFGGSHTRFAAIIFNTFEAAVLSLYLCTLPDCPFDLGDEGNEQILGLNVPSPTQAKMIQMAEVAFGRLQVLAEVSEMAASGARVVAQLFAKATTPKSTSNEISPDQEPETPAGPAPFSNGIWPMCADPEIFGNEDAILASLGSYDTALALTSESAATTVAAEDLNSYLALQLHNSDFLIP